MHSGKLTLTHFSISEKNPRRRSVAILYALAIIALIAIAAAPTRAQEHWPSGAVARFTGEDISFEGSALGPPIPGGTSFFISSGSVLTVHSGDARLNLPGGGTVDICGPAKLTLLESNTVYTIALNFGRVHVRLADPTQLHVFTPFVMATPVSIAEEARDITIGLDINDAMCVFAAQGAARLEDQFSSENLMVPQLGEFFLSGEKLSPTGGPSGTCRCFRNETAAQPRMAPSPQPRSTQPEIARSTAPPAQPAAPPVAPPSAAAPAPSPTNATNQTPPPTGVTARPVPSKPQRPAATSAANQPPPPAPSVAATQPASLAPATTPASPFPKASKSKPTPPPTSSTQTAQQPPPSISASAPRSTSMIPTVEAAAPPPPPAEPEPTEASNPPAKTQPPAAARTISGSAPEADNGFTMPEHANETKPVPVHIFGSAPTAPQLEPPVRVVMPPLTFSNTMPTPPVDTNPQLVTLVREARVTKEWVFKGHVAETKFAATPSGQSENPKSLQQKRKRRNILTVFKQFFGGNPPPPK